MQVYVYAPKAPGMEKLGSGLSAMSTALNLIKGKARAEKASSSGVRKDRTKSVLSHGLQHHLAQFPLPVYQVLLLILRYTERNRVALMFVSTLPKTVTSHNYLKS